MLASCATGASQQVRWFNPTIGPELQAARFTIDSTECEALARQFIPEPTPDDPPPPNAFAAGAAASQRQRARRDYFNACLTIRGWEEREQPRSDK